MVDFVATWGALGRDLGENGDAWDSLGDDLHARHAEPQRHYHVARHIESVITHLGTLDALAPVTLLAAFFHDAIYDPTATDNEARSAELAETELARFDIDPHVVASVAAMIRATAGHQLPGRAGDLTKWFLDADLAILAAPPAVYDRYAVDIRAEYAHVPDDDFRQGRAAVLSGFLKRSRLYFSEAGHFHWEAGARANVEREITTLGQAKP